MCEFIFDFGQFWDGIEEAEQCTKGIITLAFTNELLELIQKAIVQYEKEHKPVFKKVKIHPQHLTKRSGVISENNSVSTNRTNFKTSKSYV